MDWIDKDTTIIGVDFGENTMTDSGYPMVSKIWKRGTPLSSAVEIDRGKKADVGYWGGVTELSDGRREIFTTRAITFYNTEYYWFPLKSDGSSSTKVKLPVPEKSNLSGEFKGQILLKLNENWRGFTLGDLVSFSINDFMKNGKIDHINLVFSPDEKSSIGNFGVTQSKVLMSIYLDVKGSAYEFDWDGHNWTSSKLASVSYTHLTLPTN